MKPPPLESRQVRMFLGDGRINWVDMNNVVVGFDWSQSCCEDFWFEWTDADGETLAVGNPYGETRGKHPAAPEKLEGFEFDPSYHEKDEDCYEAMDSGAWARFRVKHENGETRYLVLYNSHNGYYGHGFDMLVDGHKQWEGSL